MRTNENKNEINEVKKWEKIKRNDLRYETKKNNIYDFQQYKTFITFIFR